MLRQGGRPRARAHARRPGRLRRARGVAGRPARIGRKGALVVHRAQETWAGEAVRVEHLRAAGAHGYLVDVGDVRAMEPGLTGDFVGASFYPADLQCAPRAIARALAEAVPRVHTGVEVQALAVEHGRVTGLRTSEGVLACDAAVIAAARGARAGAVGGRRPPARAAQGPARPSGRCETRRAAHPPQGGRGGLSGLGGERRRGPAGHHGARTTWEADVLVGSSRERRGFDLSVDDAVSAAMLERLRAHARPARARAGRRMGRAAPVAARSPAAIGPSGAVAGLWLATGHEGAGVALGPSAAGSSPSSTRAERPSSIRRRSRPTASTLKRRRAGGLPSGPSLRLLKGRCPSAPPGLRAHGPQTPGSHPRRRPGPHNGTSPRWDRSPPPHCGEATRAPLGCARSPRHGRSPRYGMVGLLVARSHTVRGAGPGEPVAEPSARDLWLCVPPRGEFALCGLRSRTMVRPLQT